MEFNCYDVLEVQGSRYVITEKIKYNEIIPKEDQDRIFERFFCVDRSHSNKDSTGLGLTIVKHIVEECHGTIDVDSKLGEGTTFTLAFEMA